MHRARNVLAKGSAHDQEEVSADFRAIFDVGDVELGDAAIAVAHRQAADRGWRGLTMTPKSLRLPQASCSTRPPRRRYHRDLHMGCAT